MSAVPSRALDRFLAWKRDPLLFVADCWPNVTLEPFQREALTALADVGRVSIRSAHGVGKSTVDAFAALWMLSTHFPCKVPATAPTAHQLEDVLRPEIGSWLREAPEAVRSAFVLKADRVVLKADPDNSFIAFRTGNRSNPDALQGFHSDNLLFILDEASGIHPAVFEVAMGALSTPGARVLMTANPTRTSGFFYDSHHKMRAGYHTMVVPASASSRVSPTYAETMARQYGIDSNIYRVRVLGEFPTADDDATIPLEWIEAAVVRDVAQVPGQIVWGLDVARFGDDRTALAKRQQNRLIEPVSTWRNFDTMQTALKVWGEYQSAPEYLKPTNIMVDTIGIGAGVVDRLKELGAPVIGINVAERPSANGKFRRYRDELWWAGREWFESMDCAIAEDEELIAELSSVPYAIKDGKIVVASKDEIKSEGRVSPDKADAFLLTLAAMRYSKPKWAPLNYSNRGIV